jgi:hypothetical protein
MFLHLFGGQLTASVAVDAERELAAFDDLFAFPVKDATLVCGGVNLALLWLCRTASRESSERVWMKMAERRNRGKTSLVFHCEHPQNLEGPRQVLPPILLTGNPQLDSDLQSTEISSAWHPHKVELISIWGKETTHLAQAPVMRQVTHCGLPPLAHAGLQPHHHFLALQVLLHDIRV